MTNESVLLPVTPHSEGCEFPPQVNAYRGIVEEAVFDRLGRPTFFDEVVEMVMERLKAKIKGEHSKATAEACATRAPQGDRRRDLAKSEVRKM